MYNRLTGSFNKNCLKIVLWDPQTPFSSDVYLVSLDPVCNDLVRNIQ